MINTLVAIIDFGLALFELYCGLSGNSDNPALSLAYSILLFGVGVSVAYGKD